MMKKNLFAITLLVLTGLNYTQAQEPINTFIQQAADNVLNKEKVPGVFVGILNNGKKSYFNSGFAVPDKQVLFDSTTVFEIGSITKTFTAYVLTAVLLKNKIAESDLIITYLPDSVRQNKNLAGISFASLMNHTSGLPRLPENMSPIDQMQPYQDYSQDKLFAYLKDCQPKPDGKSNYSNLGAGLAGVLAGRISNNTFEQLISEYIFLPFTKTLHRPAGNTNKSQGYFSADVKTDFWNMNVLAPCGGLQYSGNQMLTYLQNMCYPESDNAKIIVDKLTTQTVSINPQVGVGLGWHIINIKDQPAIYWHNGGTYGFSTFCAFLKQKSKAVMVVINQSGKNNEADGLGFKIIKKLLSEE